MMRLRITGGTMDHTPFEFSPRKIYVLGREPGNLSKERSAPGITFEPITLDSRTVSRRHCRIEYQKGVGFLIRDLDSSNGIRVNRNKIREAFLKRGDVIQVGEFTFTVETDGAAVPAETEMPTDTKGVSDPINAGTLREVSAAANSAAARLQDLSEKSWKKFQKQDIATRFFILLMIAGAIGHLFVTWPLLSDARQSIFQESFQTARKSLRSFAERNRSFLVQETYGLLDCQLLRGDDEVLAKWIIDSRGRVLCPAKVSEKMSDELSEMALQRGELLDNCEDRILGNGAYDCDLVLPISEFKAQSARPELLGAARIRYSPRDAFDALKNLQTLRWKTFFLWLALLVGLWAIWRFWMKRLFLDVASAVHFAASQGAQTIENPEPFAAFEPLLQELNRLLSQRNQGLTATEKNPSLEASFLQPLFLQMLLLEERAVMVVDRENHVIAGSSLLSSVIPLNLESGWSGHLTDMVTDTHLQGDLMGFLNDLSAGSEILDRALAMSDRVLQVRGMPIVLNNDYVASILLF